MESRVHPIKDIRLGYFYIVPFSLLLNLIAALALTRRHAFRMVGMQDDISFPVLAGWLYRTLPHPVQIHEHAIAFKRLDIWLAEFARFTNFMAVELAFILFILVHIAVYYLFGYAKKAELALIEEYRNPASIRKPLKPSAAVISIGVAAGLAIFTFRYLYLVPYNGVAYDEQFFGDFFMCCWLLVWVVLTGAFIRTALIGRKALQLGPLPVSAGYLKVAGIARDKNNNPLP